jgi:hypothetical protein
MLLVELSINFKNYVCELTFYWQNVDCTHSEYRFMLYFLCNKVVFLNLSFLKNKS